MLNDLQDYCKSVGLKVSLANIIHPIQGVFVRERRIQDNILFSHENFHSFKNRGKEGC